MPLSVKTSTSTASDFHVTALPVTHCLSFGSSQESRVTLMSVTFRFSRRTPASGCAWTPEGEGAAGMVPAAVAAPAQPKKDLREILISIPRFSENDLGHEFHLAAQIHLVEDLAEAGVAKGCIRRGKDGMVQEVVGRGAELDPGAFGNRECLRQGEVHVVHARRTDRADARAEIAPRIVCRLGKGAGIEVPIQPVHDRPADAGSRIAIGVGAATPRPGGAAHQAEANRESALEGI